jgi:16S rRNA (cytosine967-C5)-methyltransferase
MKTINGQERALEDVRALAAKTLHKLQTQKISLTLLLSPYKNRSDFPLLQEITYGTCRWFFLLEWVLTQLLEKPLRNKDSDVKSLILIGLYQLRFMDLPDYAAINETVTASAKLKKPWSRGLINGVLRSYLRQADAIDEALERAPEFTGLSMPQWLIDQVMHDWPTYGAAYFTASNQRPPMVLRVNTTQTTTAEYLTRLNDIGFSAKAGQLAATSIYLEHATGVRDLPDFESGYVSVQDESSQLIPGLLQLEPGHRVLDACAAPGGKTCHILESQQQLGSMTAIELVAGRAVKIQENLTRLKLSAEVKVADATALDQWWDGQLFDRILLDAPCSATGILRRHPDIKILRSPVNISELNTIQAQLLASSWKCLKLGGLLLYTTCSVLKAENELIIAKFLKSAPDAKYEGIVADWGVECALGRQLLPAAVDGPDGFFFSLLRKVS